MTLETSKHHYLSRYTAVLNERQTIDYFDPQRLAKHTQAFCEQSRTAVGQGVLERPDPLAVASTGLPAAAVTASQAMS